MLSGIGSRVLLLAAEFGAYTQLVGAVIRGTFSRAFEWRQFSLQLERIGVESFPVVSVACVFTGMVFTLQTYDGFARFQAETYVPGVLGLALLRELAPVLGGMMMAGRVGSAMAAELGTMKVTNQIDALEVMACDPIKFLVVPRFLATTLMLPLLITLGDLLGLLAGWYLVDEVLRAPIPGFMDRVFEFMDPEDYWSGMIKAGVFGTIIATVGCYQGLRTRGGAAGVGKSTTAAVVLSCTGILIADFLLTKLMF